MVSTQLAEKFAELFAGSDLGYGTYDMSHPTTDEKGKIVGRPLTHRGVVTVEMWERHILGKEPGLGIIPIRSNNQCVFGAVDIDIYPTSHTQIVERLSRERIPAVVCRSKSTGAHIYLFCRSPIPARKMHDKLGEIAALLGYGGCEIFPKQAQILADQGDVGNWINVPYFGGDRAMRYAVDPDGNAFSPSDFLEYAQATAVEPAWFDKELIRTDEFSEGPPCLQALVQIGFPDGVRNNGLFDIGVYLRRARPDSWEKELENYNHRYMKPPLTVPEVQGVVKSLNRKSYQYKCTDSPIAQHCNASLCRTRKFGVGSGSTGKFPTLGGLTKLNVHPPIWFWTVDSVRIELSTEELQNPRRFQQRCMEYIHVMPAIPSLQVWQAAVQHALDNLSVIEAPADASPDGQFWEWVEKFCTSRSQALTIEELTIGKPHTSEGRTYFRIGDLMTYLQKNKFMDFKLTKVASMLRDVGANHHFQNLRGRPTNYWSLKEFIKPHGKLTVPDDVSGKDAF